MIDEDMLCMALFPVIYGLQESLGGLVAKLTDALQKLHTSLPRHLRRRAARSYCRYRKWGIRPIGMIVDDGSETVHWQVMGKHMGVETPACAYTTDIQNEWTFKSVKQLKITCPECRKLLGYARKVAARRM